MKTNVESIEKTDEKTLEGLAGKKAEGLTSAKPAATISMEKFSVQVDPGVLDDLCNRLKQTHWPEEIGADWSYGTNLAYLKSLVHYWHSEYDWTEQQHDLNRYDHFRAAIDGERLHFVHHRSAERRLPLLLLHGWPDSFYRYWKMLPHLASSFEVVVPSLPGFGFSDALKPGMMSLANIADRMATLMRALGYDRYVVAGGDWGAGIAEKMAERYPEVCGLHMTDVPYQHLFSVDRSALSNDESVFMQGMDRWMQSEGGYYSIQSTKPQTLAFSLNDSPAGLASWIIEKFHTWSDGDLDGSFGRDPLLTNVMIYWISKSIGSSMRIYAEGMQADWSEEGTGEWQQQERLTTPVGIAAFPHDISLPPREYAERFYDVKRYSALKQGGHFAAMEVPQLLAEEIRLFAEEANLL